MKRGRSLCGGEAEGEAACSGRVDSPSDCLMAMLGENPIVPGPEAARLLAKEIVRVVPAVTLAAFSEELQRLAQSGRQKLQLQLQLPSAAGSAAAALPIPLPERRGSLVLAPSKARKLMSPGRPRQQASCPPGAQAGAPTAQAPAPSQGRVTELPPPSTGVPRAWHWQTRPVPGPGRRPRAMRRGLSQSLSLSQFQARASSGQARLSRARQWPAVPLCCGASQGGGGGGGGDDLAPGPAREGEVPGVLAPELGSVDKGSSQHRRTGLEEQQMADFLERFSAAASEDHSRAENLWCALRLPLELQTDAVQALLRHSLGLGHLRGLQDTSATVEDTSAVLVDLVKHGRLRLRSLEEAFRAEAVLFASASTSAASTTASASASKPKTAATAETTTATTATSTSALEILEKLPFSLSLGGKEAFAQWPMVLPAAWRLLALTLVGLFPQPIDASWGWRRLSWSWPPWWAWVGRCLDVLEALSPSTALSILVLVLFLLERQWQEQGQALGGEEQLERGPKKEHGAPLPLLLQREPWRSPGRVVLLQRRLYACMAKCGLHTASLTALGPLGLQLGALHPAA